MKNFMVALASLSVLAASNLSIAAPEHSNRQVLDSFLRLVDSNRGNELGQFETPDVVFRNPFGVLNGAAHQQLVAGFANAFPNLKHTITRCVETGELLSCEGTFAGDHTGPLGMPDGSALPATHKHVEFGWSAFVKVSNGKLSELNVYFDVLGFLAQLGVGPGAPKNLSM